MGVYQGGENSYVDFVFKGQRARESIKRNHFTLNPFETGLGNPL